MFDREDFTALLKDCSGQNLLSKSAPWLPLNSVDWHWRALSVLLKDCGFSVLWMCWKSTSTVYFDQKSRNSGHGAFFTQTPLPLRSGVFSKKKMGCVHLVKVDWCVTWETEQNPCLIRGFPTLLLLIPTEASTSVTEFFVKRKKILGSYDSSLK